MKNIQVKPYLARDKSPDFAENNFPRQGELQGEDRQLTLSDVEHWEDVEPIIKEDFAEELVSRAERKWARSKGVDPEEVMFKGRERIMRTIDMKTDVKESGELSQVQSMMEDLDKKYRDVVLSNAINKIESVDELSEQVDDTEEKVIGLFKDINSKWEYPPAKISPKTKKPISINELKRIKNPEKYGPRGLTGAMWFGSK